MAPTTTASLFALPPLSGFLDREKETEKKIVSRAQPGGKEPEA